MAASTSEESYLDDRLKSLEEASLLKSAKLDHLAQTQKSAFESMMNQMKEMNDSLQRRLNLQQLTNRSTSLSTANIPPLMLPPSPVPTQYATHMPQYSQNFPIPNALPPSIQSLPSYSAPTSNTYFDHTHQQPFSPFMSTQNLSSYPSFSDQSNPTYFNLSPCPTTNFFSQTEPQPNQHYGSLPEFSGEDEVVDGNVMPMVTVDHSDDDDCLRTDEEEEDVRDENEDDDHDGCVDGISLEGVTAKKSFDDTCTPGVRHIVCEALNLFLPPVTPLEEAVNVLNQENGFVEKGVICGGLMRGQFLREMEDETMKYYESAIGKGPKVKMKVNGALADTAFNAGEVTCNKRHRNQQQPDEDSDASVSDLIRDATRPVSSLCFESVTSRNKEIFDILNLLEYRLQHVNGTFVLATIKMFMKYPLPKPKLVGRAGVGKRYKILSNSKHMVPTLLKSGARRFVTRFLNWKCTKEYMVMGRVFRGNSNIGLSAVLISRHGAELKTGLGDSFLADRLLSKGQVVLTVELTQGIKSGDFQIVEELLCIFSGIWGEIGLAKYCVEVFDQISLIGFISSTSLYYAVIRGIFYDLEVAIGGVELKDGIPNCGHEVNELFASIVVDA